MKLDREFGTLLKELVQEERDAHRNGNGGLDKEACARAVVERVKEDYPGYAEYMSLVGPIFMVEARTTDSIRHAETTGTAGENGSAESRDMRLFVNVPGVGYIYFSEATIGQVRQEIVRRRKSLAADRDALAQLEWAVEVAGTLGGQENDRVGEYVEFAS